MLLDREEKTLLLGRADVEWDVSTRAFKGLKASWSRWLAQVCAEFVKYWKHTNGKYILMKPRWWRYLSCLVMSSSTCTWNQEIQWLQEWMKSEHVEENMTEATFENLQAWWSQRLYSTTHIYRQLDDNVPYYKIVFDRIASRKRWFIMDGKTLKTLTSNLSIHNTQHHYGWQNYFKRYQELYGRCGNIERIRFTMKDQQYFSMKWEP